MSRSTGASASPLPLSCGPASASAGRTSASRSTSAPRRRSSAVRDTRSRRSATAALPVTSSIAAREPITAGPRPHGRSGSSAAGGAASKRAASSPSSSASKSSRSPVADERASVAGPEAGASVRAAPSLPPIGRVADAVALKAAIAAMPVSERGSAVGTVSASPEAAADEAPLSRAGAALVVVASASIAVASAAREATGSDVPGKPASVSIASGAVGSGRGPTRSTEPVAAIASARSPARSSAFGLLRLRTGARTFERVRAAAAASPFGMPFRPAWAASGSRVPAAAVAASRAFPAASPSVALSVPSPLRTSLGRATARLRFGLVAFADPSPADAVSSARAAEDSGVARAGSAIAVLLEAPTCAASAFGRAASAVAAAAPAVGVRPALSPRIAVAAASGFVSRSGEREGAASFRADAVRPLSVLRVLKTVPRSGAPRRSPTLSSSLRALRSDVSMGTSGKGGTGGGVIAPTALRSVPSSVAS